MDLIGADPTEGKQRIGYDDRRANRRYGIPLNVRWKLRHGKPAADSGTGTTVDVSSSGLFFKTDRELPVGVTIELSIAWPVLLRNVAPLQLKVVGEVVRTAGRRVAVRIRHHEFRTAAMVVVRGGTNAMAVQQ